MKDLTETKRYVFIFKEEPVLRLYFTSGKLQSFKEGQVANLTDEEYLQYRNLFVLLEDKPAKKETKVEALRREGLNFLADAQEIDDLFDVPETDEKFDRQCEIAGIVPDDLEKKEPIPSDGTEKWVNELPVVEEKKVDLVVEELDIEIVEDNPILPPASSGSPIPKVKPIKKTKKPAKKTKKPAKKAKAPKKTK